MRTRVPTRGRAIYASLKSPVGVIWVAASSRGIFLLTIGADRERFEERLRRMRFRPRMGGGLAGEAARQLREYFMGERTSFSLPLDLRGTPFQLAVWQTVMKIPYGETRSYRWVAEEVGRPRAARAVGRALAANPVPIIVPCHRVVGSDGGLRGYSLGPGIKGLLLGLERGAKQRTKCEEHSI